MIIEQLSTSAGIFRLGERYGSDVGERWQTLVPVLDMNSKLGTRLLIIILAMLLLAGCGGTSSQGPTAVEEASREPAGNTAMAPPLSGAETPGSNENIAAPASPDSEAGEVSESTYDVGCMDVVLGKPRTDAIVYGGAAATSVELGEIGHCQLFSADANPREAQRESQTGRGVIDTEKPPAQSSRGDGDRPSGPGGNQGNSDCSGADQDEGGLPIGPQCNVVPPPLPAGVRAATLLSATLPSPAYEEPAENCSEQATARCPQLKWEPVSDVLAGEFVEIEISLTDPNVMYAGVDSNDMTFYRSRDGGATWKLVHVTGHNSGVAISPTDPNIVLYTNLEAAVQRTDDGGETWGSVLGANPDSGEATPFTAIAFSKDQPNIVYTTGLRSGDSRGGIWPPVPIDVFRSADSGRTWDRVGTCETCASVQNIAVKEGNPNVVWLAADGGLQVSEDGGRTWSGSLIPDLDQRALKKINEGEPPQVNGFALQPGNPETMLAASSNYGMYRSTDGGQTWVRSNLGLSSSQLHHVHFASSNPDVAYVTTHEGVFRSNDAGRSWSNRSDGLPYKFVTPLAIHPDNEDVIYVGTSTETYTTHPRHKNRGLHDGEGLYKSVDGGKTWSRSDKGIYEAKIAQIATNPLVPFNFWVGGESGRGNFFSPDAGSSWLFSPSIAGHYPMVYAYSYDIPAVIYATGWLATGEFMASTDQGASWYTLTHKLNEGLSTKTKNLGLRTEGATDFHIHGVAVAPSDPSVIYVGSVHDAVYPDLTFNLTGAHIFKSSDHGESFPEMSNGFPIETKTSINAIVIHPTNPDVAYAMTSLHESETAIGIYKTMDGARSWFPVNDGLDVFTNDLQIDPINPEILYAATETGIFKTINGGGTWIPSSGGIPEGPVIDMAIDPLNPMVLYAITPEDIYRTQNGAGYWYSVNQGLPLLPDEASTLSVQDRLFARLRLDPTATGHSVYGGTFAQDRTLEIDATGRVVVVAVKTNRDDKDARSERLLYRAVLSPLVRMAYEFEIDEAVVEIETHSNAYDMTFDSNKKELRFIAAGPPSTESQTSITVPTTLLHGDYIVSVDGIRIQSTVAGGNTINFRHQHAGRNIISIGTK